MIEMYIVGESVNWIWIVDITQVLCVTRISPRTVGNLNKNICDIMA
jgi:hypothetical protein